MVPISVWMRGVLSVNDVNFLKHSLAYYNSQSAPNIACHDVKITKLAPAKRVYGGKATAQEQTKKEQVNG